MGIAKNLMGALQAVAGDLEKLRARMGPLQERLAEIDGQVRSLREAPISLEEYAGYVAKFVASRGRLHGQGLRLRELVRPNRGTGFDAHVPAYLKPWESFESEDGSFVESSIQFSDSSNVWRSGDVFGALCFFAPELVAERLHQQLHDDVSDKWAPTDSPPIAQRRALIAQLDQERGAVEAELGEVTQAIDTILAVVGV